MDEFSPAADRAALIDIWREADKVLSRLLEKEAGCADQAVVLPLPPAMAPHAAALQACAHTNLAHSLVPVLFGLVEFDGLMTCKHTLQQAKLDAVQSRLPTAPEDPELASMCLALPGAPASAAVGRWDGERLLVVCEDADVRLLQVTHATEPSTAAPGMALAALQLTVGTTLPAMHVVKLDGRVLMAKGHHRARVLRAMGVNYLPCLVSVCESIDDVLAAAPTLNPRAVERCFDAERPAMLRDFGRSALVHSYEARSRRRLLQLKLEVSSQWLP